ncbi:hypothetical protein DL768_011110 [Monosporascus sp. mg162]|nr:hypothetical protein DL768_011110 [Monosporascus sp. mg162]
MPGFVECSFPGCATSSSVSQFQAMTLRTGMSVCTNHMTSEYLGQAIARTMSDYACSPKVVIYYDIELSRDGEVEQLGAYTSGGEFYSAFMRTSVISFLDINLLPKRSWGYRSSR